MNEFAQGRRRERLPFGLLGMILCIVLIERYIARHDERYMTPHEHDWRASGVRAEGAEGRAEVLCFGDSMLKFGLVPHILQARLGRSTHCLALLDGKPAASYFLLRRAIESGARPRAVLVDFQPECMFQETASLSANRHWKALLSPAEAADYAWNYRDADFLGRILLARWLPSYRGRTELRSSVLLALQGQPSPNPLDNAKVWRNRNMNQGALVLARQPAYRGDVPPGIANSLYSTDWFSRPENTRYVRRFLALAQAHGIPVVWVLPPNTPEAEATRSRLGIHGRYDAFLTRLMARHENLHVADARGARFPHDVFVDPVHLDRIGAVALSLRVADALRPLLDRESNARSRDRWVALPPFEPPATDFALEDMDQSQATLIARWNQARSTRLR